MSIKTELEKLKQIDIWSIMLFVLYKFQSIPEYSSLSELAYILDEKNLLKLCEYFGGQTIRVPTIDEFEETLYAMLLFQYTDVEKMNMADALTLLRVDKSKEKLIQDRYKTVKETLTEYQFTARGHL